MNHVPELARMGADISVEGNMIILNGPNKFHGAEVVASDLRAGACLVIAGLMAEGTTTIYNVEYILRGYDHIIEKLTAIGASIKNGGGSGSRMSDYLTMAELENKTLKDVYSYAKEFKIPYYSKMNKRNYP